MNIEPLNDLPLLRELGVRAAAAGLELYAVGGCVRDWALGRESLDIDFLCSGDPSGLAAFAAGEGGEVTRFHKFLTIRAFTSGGRRFDFARFRNEIYPSEGALPQVGLAASASEDLRRRDFTANAVALSLLPSAFGSPLDPFCGLAAARAGVIAVLHPASFRDDPTRIFRAARFAARFGWSLEPETLGLARQACADGLPGRLSIERRRNELLKILSEREPSAALGLLYGWGALASLPAGLRISGIPAGGALARLAFMASGLGAGALPFLKSLNLPRPEFAALRDGFEAAAGRRKVCGQAAEIASLLELL